jgi:hypothetical protein
MKRNIIFVVVLWYGLIVNGMDSVDLNQPPLVGVVVESASGSEQGGTQSFSLPTKRGERAEPKNLHEVKQLVRERSNKGKLPEKRINDVRGVSDYPMGAVFEPVSNSVTNSPKKSTPRKLKIFMSSGRPDEELKNSKGEARVVPRTVSDVERLVKSRSMRSSEPIARSCRKSVPVFSREQLEQVHQNRQSKKLYTEEDVQRMVDIQEKHKKSRQSKKLYTEEEVAAILQQASCNVTPLISSRFRKYGQEYNVPLQELPQYAQLLDDIVITPRVLAEFMYQRHGTDSKPESYEVRAYEKLSKRDPAHYEKLVFGLLKEIVNEDGNLGDEQNKSLPREFVDTHVRLLQHEIGSQSDDIFKYRVAVVVKLLALACTTAWALYGQISQSSATPGCSNSTTG